MKKTLNIGIREIEDFKKTNINISDMIDTWVWISISDPDYPIYSKELSSLEHIKLSFYDIQHPIEVLNGEMVYPANDKQILDIYNFIVKHQDKNIIVNCVAGISRSGAICKFISEEFGHNWLEYGKKHAIPNTYLYNNLKRIKNENN